MNYCFNCEKPTRNKFCSIICQKDYEYKKYILINITYIIIFEIYIINYLELKKINLVRRSKKIL